ncbi:MAG: hypothetical protein WD671_03020, partial [Parvibaculum sp.]
MGDRARQDGGFSQICLTGDVRFRRIESGVCVGRISAHGRQSALGIGKLQKNDQRNEARGHFERG